MLTCFLFLSVGGRLDRRPVGGIAVILVPEIAAPVARRRSSRRRQGLRLRTTPSTRRRRRRPWCWLPVEQLRPTWPRLAPAPHPHHAKEIDRSISRAHGKHRRFLRKSSVRSDSS